MMNNITFLIQCSIVLMIISVIVIAAKEDTDDDFADFNIGRSELKTMVPLTLLPSETGALCLDGSPYGFYFVPSTTGSKSWTIMIQGGGWCYNETLCYARSKTRLGSSKFFRKKAGCNCMNVNDKNEIEKDCNCIYMPYGDGASFSGYRKDPWHVVEDGKEVGELYFRGFTNIQETLTYAFKHLNLDQAENVILTGGSAGGLSTFLHSDYVANRLKEEAPNAAPLKSAPVVGFFLDHPNYVHSSSSYPNWMNYIYHMQNLTVGALMPECLKTYAETPYYCFMSPHMAQFIKTPFFVFNSKYDQWQMDNILQVPCIKEKNVQCNNDEETAILNYGKSFLSAFNSQVMKFSKNGGAITSCICHGCNWDTIKINGVLTYKHYINWHNGNSGKDTFHIDPSTPNGDGKMNITENHCSRYP